MNDLLPTEKKLQTIEDIIYHQVNHEDELRHLHTNRLHIPRLHYPKASYADKPASLYAFVYGLLP